MGLNNAQDRNEGAGFRERPGAVGLPPGAVAGRAPAAIVIPARLASTRLPEKLLLSDTGMTVLEHTYRAACGSRRARGVWIAAADAAIAQAARRFGAPVVATSPDAPTGTDRVAEAARRLPGAEIIVNVQGDEPEIDGDAIDALIDRLLADPAAPMATLAAPIRSRAVLEDPACVKVVFDASGRALYFSRSPIPHARVWEDGLLEADPPLFWQHVGVYAYRRAFLLEFASQPPVLIERTESLEQLRALHAGHTIHIETIERAWPGIDTPEDYRAFVARWRATSRRSA